MTVSLDRLYKDNALAGLTFNSGDVSHVIYSNTKTTISFNDAVETTTTTTPVETLEITVASGSAESLPPIVQLTPGDSFEIVGTLYEQLPGFAHKTTTVEDGNYHNTNMVDGYVSGKILFISSINASYVDILVTDTINFNIPLVQLRGDLFHEAKIVFTNLDNPNIRYVTEVVSHDASGIKVRTAYSSYWDASGYSIDKISAGWDWEIDATNYGYTQDTMYDDFVVTSKKLTADLGINDVNVTLEDVTGIVVGDIVRLQDDTLSYVFNHVIQVVDGYTVKLLHPATRSFYQSRNSQIKVLRDVFSNTHQHQIRNNEVEVITVPAYLEHGYPIEHSHRVLPLIADVSSLIGRNTEIIAAGSSSIIYGSLDNGTTWNNIADLNDFLEGSDEIDGVSALTLYNGSLVAGATNGNIFITVNNV
jgi:hypothetical protein